jgi:hypothetical protein
MNLKERRKAKRIEADIDIAMSGESGEATGKTLNISTNGVYFQSPQFMEPLTKVRLELLIPPHPKSKDGKASSAVFDGVIVRVDPEQHDPSVSSYNIAVFFTQVSESSQKVLEGYIRHRLSS